MLKARETPYGATVIPNLPNGPTTPGGYDVQTFEDVVKRAAAESLGFASPVMPSIAGSTVKEHGPAPTPTETLGQIIGAFLDKIVDHVVERAAARVVELMETEIKHAQTRAEDIRPELEARTQATIDRMLAQATIDRMLALGGYELRCEAPSVEAVLREDAADDWTWLTNGIYRMNGAANIVAQDIPDDVPFNIRVAIRESVFVVTMTAPRLYALDQDGPQRKEILHGTRSMILAKLDELAE